MPSKFGSLGTGLLQGFQAGAGIKERREDRKQQVQQQGEINDLRKINMATSVMSNKDMPNSVKLQSFNDIFAPLWNKLMGGENQLSKLPQWHTKVGDYVKRAKAIMDDKSFTRTQKRGFLSGLQTEAAGDADLAPMMEEIDVQIQEQTKKDELTAFDIYNDRLTAGDEFTDEEVSTLMQIRERSPGAILNVANTLDKRKGEAKTPNTIDLAIKAANVPANIDEMTPEDAVNVLGELKKLKASSSDLGDFMEMVRQNKSQSYWNRFLGLFGGGQVLKEAEQVQEQVSPVRNEFSSQDQDALNNVLNQPVQ